MIRFFVLVGIPGSGKTTLAHELAEKHNATVHSYDDIPNANITIDGSIKQAWIASIRDDLQSGQSVVCDGLNLTVAERKDLLSVIADIPCEKILVFKIVPLEICLKRNRERQTRLPDFVIEQSARKIEPPTPDEGWDKILVSTD